MRTLINSLLLALVLIWSTPAYAQWFGPPSGWVDTGTNIYTTTATDNVGIGTAIPFAKLDIAGNIAINGVLGADNQIMKMSGTTLNWEADGGAAGAGATSLGIPVQSAKLTGAFVTHTPAGCSTTPATVGAGIDAGDGNWRLRYDATADEGAIWQFVMPNNYSSAPILKIHYTMTSATALEVEFEASIMCVSDADAADVGTASFANCVVGSATVPGTVGYVDVISITLTDDTCAAGDAVWIYLSTDSDDATSDDATGDREVIGLDFQYTGT